MRRIKPSPSSAGTDRLAQLRRGGRDIVSLMIGEPDFDTPEHIRRAAIAAIDGGQTRYTQTAGTLALRQAICAKLQRENGLSYEPGRVIVTVGAKHAIFNALARTLVSAETQVTALLELFVRGICDYWVQAGFKPRRLKALV